jgi:hypothetical protein
MLSQLQQKSNHFEFNAPAISCIMRGCKHLRYLEITCSDWSTCIESESWGELPVPPLEVIRRGTNGVLQFVKAVLRGNASTCRSCRVMVVGPQMVYSRAFTCIIPAVTAFAGW